MGFKMVVTKTTPRRTNLMFPANYKQNRSIKTEYRKNNNIYAFIKRELNSRYKNNKTNRQKNRVGKKKNQFVLTKIVNA